MVGSHLLSVQVRFAIPISLLSVIRSSLPKLFQPETLYIFPLFTTLYLTKTLHTFMQHIIESYLIKKLLSY